MIYEAVHSKSGPDGSEWRVEAIDYENDGECYVTIFSGPKAQQRAKAYAAWQNPRPAGRPDWVQRNLERPEMRAYRERSR